MVVERMRIAPWGKPRVTIYLEISKETDEWVSGTEVDKEGDRVDRVHLIDKTAIVKRTPVEMNLHYGKFEEVKSSNPIGENPMNCTGCGKAISGAYKAGSYSCSGCGVGVQINPTSNPLTAKKREDVERALDNHEKLKGSYFWKNLGNASSRRNDEKKYNFTVTVEYKGDLYEYESRVRVSTKNFYYNGGFFKNDKKGDVRIFKKLLASK